jgi:hypothetical protein
MTKFGLDTGEMRVLKLLKTPEKIQRFLDIEVGYNKEPDGDTVRSPRRVLRDRVAHCLEGALLAATALRVQGFPPLLMDLEAVNDDDHVLAVFKMHGHWGAIAKSNYSGLRFREPVYRTLRELAMSYFEHYFNLKQEKTLRAYARPMNLSRFDPVGWMTAEEDLWVVNDYLADLKHVPLLQNGAGQRMARVDDRLFAAGLAGRVA